MAKKANFLARLLILVLICTLVIPCTGYATETNPASPRASAYLTSYNTYIYRTASNEIQVWFTVVRDTTMDEIGALSVILYESSDNSNWTRVKTYSYEDYSSMLRYDNYVHTSHVSYNGSSSKYYKAYVCIWAGKNGSGDTRYMWAYE